MHTAWELSWLHSLCKGLAGHLGCADKVCVHMATAMRLHWQPSNPHVKCH